MRIVRSISRAYADPVDLIWIHAAMQLGMQVQRSHEVNASWDGRQTLTIGTAETLDADDCLAQMILHEICHALCEGPESLTKPDWGLESFDSSKRIHEHACLRLQAALADRFGLRQFFASTTMFRRYYDHLPPDPLATDGDPAVAMARLALRRATDSRWLETIEAAMAATLEIRRIVENLSPPDSLWRADTSARLPPGLA